MRILLWHGWLLEGSGSNVYTAKVAEAFMRQGHDVLLLCQEPHAERFGFVDGIGAVGASGISWANAGSRPSAPGRVRLLRPEIGRLLPVFVLDEYEGFHAKRFADLSEAELDRYLDRNVAALRTAAEWFRPDATVAGHVIPGAVIARRALGRGCYAVKVHGSDLEYAMRVDRRYVDLAREGLEGAVAVTGATHDVLARAEEFVPAIAGRSRVVPPGVDVELFRPRPRRRALLRAADLLDRDPATSRGRPESIGGIVESSIRKRPAELDRRARAYDQEVPDPDAAQRLRGLAAGRGPLVGYFGKFIPQKGVDLLIQALALLPNRVRALIVGFGTFREWLAALVLALDSGDAATVRWVHEHSEAQIELTPEEVERARGLGARISFTGRLDHRYAPFALAALDVLVVPSVLREAFGMVAAEGAAAGALPLVARHSGLGELAGALERAVSRPGLFSYEPGEGAPRRIAEGIDRLLSLPRHERDDLRAGVSEFVTREWTWERTAERLLDAAVTGPPGVPGA